MTWQFQDQFPISAPQQNDLSLTIVAKAGRKMGGIRSERACDRSVSDNRDQSLGRAQLQMMTDIMSRISPISNRSRFLRKNVAADQLPDSGRSK
jgi:hypothetical protein